MTRIQTMKLTSILLSAFILNLCGKAPTRRDLSLPKLVSENSNQEGLQLSGRAGTDLDLENESQFELDLWGVWGPLQNKVSVPACRNFLPDQFKLGELECVETGKTLSISAKHMSQFCSRDERYRKEPSETLRFASPCSKALFKPFKFNPDLCIYINRQTGRQYRATKPCLQR